MFWIIFSVFKKIGFWAILGPPYRGIGATIRVGQEMFCLPYAGFFFFRNWDVSNTGGTRLDSSLVNKQVGTQVVLTYIT